VKHCHAPLPRTLCSLLSPRGPSEQCWSKAKLFSECPLLKQSCIYASNLMLLTFFYSDFFPPLSPSFSYECSYCCNSILVLAVLHCRIIKEITVEGLTLLILIRDFTSPRRPDRLWDPPNLLSNGYRRFFPVAKAAWA
jgi:hypothetical protein